MTDEEIYLDLTIRPFEPSIDLGFLLKCWLLSFRPAKARTNKLIYFKSQEQLIKNVIQRDSVRAVCCVERDRPDFIFGVAVAETLITEDPTEPLIVHWVFTKLAYRKQGIARAMLQALGWYPGRTIQATHKNIFVMKNADRFRILENDYPLKGIYHGRHVTYHEGKIYNPYDPPLRREDDRAIDLEALESENL